MESIIEIKGLTKEYSSFLALDNISLKIEGGKIYGLLGRNGAGKTTIMKSILGLTFPTKGKIYIKDSLIDYKDTDQFSIIGSMIETPAFYSNLSARENLELFALIRGVTEKNAIEKSLDLVGLDSNSNKTFASFSMGMKQRLGIANAILHEPEVLILDEPTNGLDPIGIVEVRNILIDLCKNYNKTILISSHILSEIEKIVDDIAFIERGKVLEESSIEDIKNRYEKYTSYIVSDVNNSARVLEESYKSLNYIVIDNHEIRVFGLDDRTNRINKLLINNGIDVFQITTQNESLEDYFKKLTGGDKN